MPSLTRRVTFTATHRYWRSDWSADRNQQLFGSAAIAHSHDYACDVTVSGPIDADTGMIVDLGALDRILDREVRTRFHGVDINAQIPAFADRKLIPTCENLARFIFERVSAALVGAGTLSSVIVREDETLSAEFTGS
ncbi:MAG: 6-pyruvoyl trahydropterin synthase family protein [Gemmatimonadaceae bacterium]